MMSFLRNKTKKQKRHSLAIVSVKEIVIFTDGSPVIVIPMAIGRQTGYSSGKALGQMPSGPSDETLRQSLFEKFWHKVKEEEESE